MFSCIFLVCFPVFLCLAQLISSMGIVRFFMDVRAIVQSFNRLLTCVVCCIVEHSQVSSVSAND